MAPSFLERAVRELAGGRRNNLSGSSLASPPDATKTASKASKSSKASRTSRASRASLPAKTTGNSPNEPSLPTNQSTPVNGGSGLQSLAIKENLWDLAYELLKNDKEKTRLIETYEKILSEESKGISATSLVPYDVASTKDREQKMTKVVQEKFQAVQDARWRFEVFSKEIEVRKQFDRVVGAVIWAKDFITQAVSPEPHTALAWAGVCLLLPLLLNPSLQRNAAIRGLDTVTNLIRQSKVIDELYFDSAAEAKTMALQDLKREFRDKRIKFYSQILEFEAQLVCYFSTSEFKQMAQDVVKHDSWDKMVDDIQKTGLLSDSDRQIIDAERMKSAFKQLENGMQNALDKLEIVSRSIEADFSGLRRQFEDRERANILAWLSPLDLRVKQMDTLRRRQEGTGEQLFGDSAFKSWLGGEEKTLLCSGIPGAGKTILASLVIDHLEQYGHQTIVQLLLEKGAIVDAKDTHGQTPLYRAARKGHEAVVRLLLDKHAAIDVKDLDGETSLWVAAENGHETVVQLLLEKGAILDAKDNQGQAPLYRAARKGHEGIARLLINKGAIIDAKDPWGQTPLVGAVNGGNEAIVQLLLSKGAAVNNRDDEGQTPLWVAADQGYEAIARLLIKKGAAGGGAKIDAKDAAGRTPLWAAVKKEREAVVQLLRSIRV